MTLRLAGIAISFCTLLGATPGFVDSQYVLERYARAIDAVTMPKVVVYSYTISQVGPSNIEQHHRIYRNGMEVRDETLSVDGIPLSRKIVRFSRREDRYTVEQFAAADELLRAALPWNGEGWPPSRLRLRSDAAEPVVRRVDRSSNHRWRQLSST